MEQVSFTEAKAKLAALIDRVEAGEEIIITRHGHPAARLVSGHPSKAKAKKTLRSRESKYTLLEVMHRMLDEREGLTSLEEIMALNKLARP